MPGGKPPKNKLCFSGAKAKIAFAKAPNGALGLPHLKQNTMKTENKIKNTKNKNFFEKCFHGIFLLCGVISVAFVLFISVYLIIAGVPAIEKIGILKFLFGPVWNNSNEQYGILAFILTSIYGTAGAVLLGVPIGIFTAVYLAKKAPPKIYKTVHIAVGVLAGIPSVVYGLIGMIIIVPAIQKAFNLSSGANLLSAILVLTVMILPYIINVSVTALKAVPPEYEEASLALGATKTETFFYVSLKAAKSGVVTSVMQGVGRAVGEAMAVIMVAGNVANMPGLLKSVRFLTTAIVSEMSYAPYGSLQRQALFSIGLVLFLFIMLINGFLYCFVRREKE